MQRKKHPSSSVQVLFQCLPVVHNEATCCNSIPIHFQSFYIFFKTNSIYILKRLIDFKTLKWIYRVFNRQLHFLTTIIHFLIILTDNYISNR